MQAQEIRVPQIVVFLLQAIFRESPKEERVPHAKFSTPRMTRVILHYSHAVCLRFLL